MVLSRFQSSLPSSARVGIVRHGYMHNALFPLGCAPLALLQLHFAKYTRGDGGYGLSIRRMNMPSLEYLRSQADSCPCKCDKLTRRHGMSYADPVSVQAAPSSHTISHEY